MYKNPRKTRRIAPTITNETKEFSSIPSIPLPNELLQYEVLARLDLPSILSFCVTDKQTKAFCDRYDLIEKNLHKVTEMNYSTLQSVVLNWIWSETRIESFMTILPSLIDHLDLYTLQIVYLYLLEQERETEAKIVKELTLKSSKHANLDEEMRSFTQDMGSYEVVNALINMIRTNNLNDPKVSFADILFQALETFYIGGNKAITSHKYLAELVGASLTDEEILRFVKYIRDNGLINVHSHHNFFNHLYHYLFLNDRLTKDMIVNSFDQAKEFVKGFVPKDKDDHYRIRVHDGQYDYLVDINPLPGRKDSLQPYIQFTVEGVLDQMNSGRVLSERSICIVLKPEEYVTIILSHINRDRLLEDVRNKTRVVAYASGYNIWYENVERLLREHGVKYSETWGWYVL